MTCPECYNTSVTPWYEQPMNETIREYACTYVSPVEAYNDWVKDWERYV